MKYSIIIPHKNSPDLLKRCLDSIPDREDIQVIVIDDNSCDLSQLTILEKTYKDRVQFIYVFEGRGAGGARNVGLEKAEGKWLLFADSDDYFSPGAFDHFDEYAETEYDVIVFKHKSVFSETGEETMRSSLRLTYIDEYLNMPSKLNEAHIRYCNDVPWAKMIRRRLIEEHQICFDEVPASNDTMFSLLAGYYASSIQVTPHVVYCATVREGSITRTKSIERYFSEHSVALRKNLFLRQIGHPECQEILLSRILIVTKLFGIKQLFVFLKEAKKYKGQIFFGVVSKLVKK